MMIATRALRTCSRKMMQLTLIVIPAIYGLLKGVRLSEGEDADADFGRSRRRKLVIPS